MSIAALHAAILCNPVHPLLFSIGIQGALEEVSKLLVASSCALSWMTYPVLAQLIGEALLRVAGTKLHQGKTRVWTKSRLQPPNPKGSLSLAQSSKDYVREKMTGKVEEERRLVGHNPHSAKPAVCMATPAAECQPTRESQLRTVPPEPIS